MLIYSNWMLSFHSGFPKVLGSLLSREENDAQIEAN